MKSSKEHEHTEGTVEGNNTDDRKIIDREKKKSPARRKTDSSEKMKHEKLVESVKASSHREGMKIGKKSKRAEKIKELKTKKEL